MKSIPDPSAVFPNEYGTSCFIRNVVTAPNILIGEYTYYHDPEDAAGFEKNNVLYNWPEFGDRLIIGKFCSIACGTKFIMGPANHRLSSVTTYPFHVFGGAWASKRLLICPNCLSKAIPLSATTYGSAGKASSCQARVWVTVVWWRPSRWYPAVLNPTVSSEAIPPGSLKNGLMKS